MLLLPLALAALAYSPTLALVSTGVIFPLYLYPCPTFGDNCTNWTPLNQAISANPQVPFLIVINPISGPGSLNSQPDSNYQRCITQLLATGSAAGRNVRLIGYVYTGQGTLDGSLIANNISTYAQWSAPYRLTGIFFDDVATSTSLASLYESYAADVRSSFGSNSFVALSPGQNPDTTAYYTFSDLVITAVDFYNNFNISTSLSITDASPANKQSVILHDAPPTTPTSLVLQLISLGIKYLFITDFPNAIAYENIPSDWVNFVHTEASVNSPDNTAIGTTTSGDSSSSTSSSADIPNTKTGNSGNNSGSNASSSSNAPNATASGNGHNNGSSASSSIMISSSSIAPNSIASGHSSDSNSSTSSSKAGPIAGGVVGGLLFVAILAAVVVLCKRKKPRQASKLKVLAPFMSHMSNAVPQPHAAPTSSELTPPSESIPASSIPFDRGEEKQHEQNHTIETSTVSNSTRLPAPSDSISPSQLRGHQLSTSELVRLLNERIHAGLGPWDVDEEMPPEYPSNE